MTGTDVYWGYGKYLDDKRFDDELTKRYVAYYMYIGPFPEEFHRDNEDGSHDTLILREPLFDEFDFGGYEGAIITSKNGNYTAHYFIDRETIDKAFPSWRGKTSFTSNG